MIEQPVDRDGASGRPDSDVPSDLRSDPHCRYLLADLQRTEDSVPVSEASRHVVSGITDTPPENISREVLRRVETWFNERSRQTERSRVG